MFISLCRARILRELVLRRYPSREQALLMHVFTRAAISPRVGVHSRARSHVARASASANARARGGGGGRINFDGDRTHLATGEKKERQGETKKWEAAKGRRREIERGRGVEKRGE